MAHQHQPQQQWPQPQPQSQPWQQPPPPQQQHLQYQNQYQQPQQQQQSYPQNGPGFQQQQQQPPASQPGQAGPDAKTRVLQLLQQQWQSQGLRPAQLGPREPAPFGGPPIEIKCIKCNVRVPNPGKQWCQSCFDLSRAPPVAAVLNQASCFRCQLYPPVRYGYCDPCCTFMMAT
eukprot:TRINITY_DN7867_c0_g1_i1.p1 TRINITY_DN7867_c0_g1~~TRINITY_DN7867_c0_g1_i1.p1  ORF type:complete len:181 (-),score=24.22 TRINITY_DN7867_c0_g1_i1:200-721(-)